MPHSLSSFHSDSLVSIQPARPPVRLRLRGPMAALLTVGAILASGVLVGQLSGHARTTYHTASQPQPFDHFPS